MMYIFSHSGLKKTVSWFRDVWTLVVLWVIQWYVQGYELPLIKVKADR